jgi:hypothetical protein
MPIRAESGLIVEARARNGVAAEFLILDACYPDCP